MFFFVHESLLYLNSKRVFRFLIRRIQSAYKLKDGNYVNCSNHNFATSILCIFIQVLLHSSLLLLLILYDILPDKFMYNIDALLNKADLMKFT